MTKLKLGRKTSQYTGFMDRLVKDGGDKIVATTYPFVHIDHTRFIPLCSALKGLSLTEAYKHLQGERRRVSSELGKAIDDAASAAHAVGLDLKSTYIADAYSRKDALLSNGLKKYIKGRGRYGSTPQFVSTTVRLVLQERTKGFARRMQDPLEPLREKIRSRSAPSEPAVHPVKPVYF